MAGPGDGPETTFAAKIDLIVTEIAAINARLKGHDAHIRSVEMAWDGKHIGAMLVAAPVSISDDGGGNSTIGGQGGGCCRCIRIVRFLIRCPSLCATTSEGQAGGRRHCSACIDDALNFALPLIWTDGEGTGYADRGTLSRSFLSRRARPLAAGGRKCCDNPYLIYNPY
ncbi:unnamed protein product [Urochloa humidicola]